MAFILFISFVVLLRLGELLLSKSNEKWLLQNGAIEFGQKHYPFIVSLHILFILSLIVEYYSKQNGSYNLHLLIFYFLVLTLKAWVILSLGKYWNTKIYHITNIPLQKSGPYIYFKHPNYMIVIIEIAVIPLIFHLYLTAILFTVLNSIMLFVRIKEENKALGI
ncbi:MAG: isoprenylcysteine carboxylmethyltransferase family protein [Paludibacter sp.]|nr:isoprenylcysteine carboxylmethyltransferase family protein [Paludibacter sp.]